MKINFIFVWVGILILAAVLPSCSKDDDTFYEASTTITSFSFDSIRNAYGERVKPSQYPFTIDLTGEGDTALIYNKDSLPYRSDLSRVLFTISSSATIYLLKGNEYVLFQSTKDTIDCYKPVILKAFGSDANGTILEKTYKVIFNVHQVNPDSIPWRSISPNFNFEGKQKSVILKNRLYLFTESGIIYSTALTDGAQWIKSPVNIPFDYTSATAFNGKLYLIASGKVYTSTDGNTWEIQESLSEGANIETLLGATSDYLAGIKGGFYCSTQGISWKTGGAASGFIRTWPTSVTYSLPTNSNIQQVAILGKNSAQSTAHSLLVAEDSLLNWSKWGPVDSTSYQLPITDRTAIIRYGDNKFYCFGGSSSTSFKDYYTSNGLYWTFHENYTFFPDYFTSRGEFSVSVDSENYIWIIFSRSTRGDAVVYKGRFNSYSF